MEREIIEQFAAGGEKLRAAVAGLNADDLAAKPGPGLWSIHEIVIHMADSDAIAIDRMKRILTEEHPMLLDANESAYIQKLHTADQSLDDALVLFEVNRRQFARVLRQLPDEAFERTGQHNLAGRVTLGGMVRSYTRHLDNHLEFVDAKRQNLGKPRGG